MSRPIVFLHGRFGRLGLVEMDSGLATHVHHHLHAVFKIGGADTRFTVRGRDHPATDTSAVLVNAWEPHGWRRRPDAPPTLFLTLYLEPDWLVEAGLLSSPGLARGFFAEACTGLDAAARTMVRALAEVMLTDHGPGSQVDDATALVAGLLSRLRAPAGDGLVIATGVFDYRIRRALDLLRQPEAVLRVEGIAREVGLSRPRFFELFHECTGFTPARYLNAARMERAIRRLTVDRASMAETALDLGFAAPGNFTRFFRQQIGVTPQSFRRAVVDLGG